MCVDCVWFVDVGGGVCDVDVCVWVCVVDDEGSLILPR